MPNLPYRTHIAYYLGRKRDNPDTTFLDRVICFFTRSKYSHVELVYSYDPETKKGSCITSSPRDGGVRSKIIDLADGHWEVYEIGTWKNPADMLSWYHDHQGAEYDWLGAIGAFIEPIKGMSKRYFCVEAVGECLDMANTNKMTPEEFFRYNELLGHQRVI